MNYRKIKQILDTKLPIENEKRADMLTYLYRQLSQLDKAASSYEDLVFTLTEAAKKEAEAKSQITSIEVGAKPQKVEYPSGYFGYYAPKTTVIFQEEKGKTTVIQAAMDAVEKGATIGEAFGKLTISPLAKSYPYNDPVSGLPHALPEGLSRLVKKPSFKFVPKK